MAAPSRRSDARCFRCKDDLVRGSGLSGAELVAAPSSTRDVRGGKGAKTFVLFGCERSFVTEIETRDDSNELIMCSETTPVWLGMDVDDSSEEIGSLDASAKDAQVERDVREICSRLRLPFEELGSSFNVCTCHREGKYSFNMVVNFASEGMRSNNMRSVRRILACALAGSAVGARVDMSIYENFRSIRTLWSRKEGRGGLCPPKRPWRCSSEFAHQHCYRYLSEAAYARRRVPEETGERLTMISELADDGLEAPQRPLSFGVQAPGGGDRGLEGRGGGTGLQEGSCREAVLRRALARTVEGSRLLADVSPLPEGRTLESMMTGARETEGTVVARLDCGHVCPFARRPHSSNGAVLSAERGGFWVRYTCLSGKCRRPRGEHASADVAAPALDLPADS
jgi:hypothetical protein